MGTLKRKCKSAYRVFKVNGVKGVLKEVKNKTSKNTNRSQLEQGISKQDIISTLSYITNREIINFNEADYNEYKGKQTTLNWLIPDVGIGGGGHINIFRFISMLEDESMHSRVYLDETRFKSDSELIRFIHEHYSDVVDKKIEFFVDKSSMKFAHATIATAWHTAYFIKNFNNTISKFYFVQDYEPYFFPVGSFYELAKETYTFGFRGITAGDWLRDVCINDFNMKAGSFGFSYDKDLYTKKTKKDKTKRVFFYARHNTARRDFEIGLLALDLLAKKHPDLEVVFAGGSIEEFEIPFKHKSLKILPISELSKVYSQCDMCLVLSNTNLSLLPLEVMASNSVAVCSNGPNNTWLVNDENSILVDFNPVNIANKMSYYFDNEEQLSKIRDRGYSFAIQTSWEQEGEKVRKLILEGIKEDDK